MLKDLFDRGKCALGFHAGEWRYMRSGDCQQTRVCSRCQAESQQTLHTWEPWEYAAADDCRMARQCSRCGEEETKTEHAWGAPVYQAEGSCEQVRPCSHCREKAPAGTTHVWKLWTYDAEDTCSQILICLRCKEAGTGRRISHDWGAWCDSAFYETRVRVCKRCAEMVFDLGNAENEQNVVSLQTVDRAVSTVMESTDAATVRERITSHRDVLFSRVAEKYFRFAIDQRAPDGSAKDTLRKLAGLIERCRTEGIDAVLNPAAASPQPATISRTVLGPKNEDVTPSGLQMPQQASRRLDARLLGHWRHTESMVSGAVSQATDTHLILDSSGGFQWWSKSVGSFGETESASQYGRWSVVESTLELEFDDRKSLGLRYALEADTMFCNNQSRYRLWSRIN
jgi:hypothetical protein